MTRAALLLFAQIAAFMAAAFASTHLCRTAEQSALGDRRVRPSAVEAALTAWERGGEPPPPTAPAPEEPDAETRADLALLRALTVTNEGALLEMARLHDGTDASARAFWLLVQRAPDAASRAARRQAFAARWPDAWVLGAPRGAP